MKLYNPAPPDFIIRVNIKQQGAKTEHINLCETTAAECLQFCKEVIDKQNLSVFQTGRLTVIETREALGGENGKTTSISFKGLTPKETYDLLLTEIQNLKK